MTDTSRRDLLKGGAVAGLAAAAAPALAQAAQGTGTPPDPRTEYPQPPFDPQLQPWPGLQSKMHPRPDCGETSYRGSGRLAGRKALLTGGDSGIGRAAAIAFAREGADVAINYLPQEESDAREVVGYIRQAGRNAVAIPGDIRDEGFCKQLVAGAVQQLGGLDILVNNAARQKSQASILDITSEQFDDTFKTNIYANFWITRAAVLHMQPGAAIISTSSVNANDPGEDIIDYAATKAAILNFSRGLAKQLGPKGIRVNVVAPGPVWTPLQVSGGDTMEKLKTFGSDTPLKRPGQPAELAALYVALASGELSYTSGSVFGANGGTGQS